MPTAELPTYFKAKKAVRFIALDEYRELVGASQEKQLINFLSELGVKKDIILIKKTIDYAKTNRTDLPHPYSTRGHIWDEVNIDGCKEIIEYIVSNKDATKSVVLWNCLLRVIETKCTSWQYRNLNALLCGTCHSFYYSAQTTSFTSSDALRLKDSKWLVDVNGEFVSPKDITKECLSESYDVTSEKIGRAHV